MKKILLIITIFSLFCLTGCGCEKRKEQKPIIKDETQVAPDEVIKDQTVDVFEFKNTSLVFDGVESTLETVVTNNSDVEQKLIEFKIIIMNGDEKISELIGFVGSTLKVKESKSITTKTSKNITKATKIIYEIVK